MYDDAAQEQELYDEQDLDYLRQFEKRQRLRSNAIET